MSIQEQTIHHDIPGQKSSSSSTVIKQGQDDYDPFAVDNDEYENEPSKDTKCLKQESIRINNGITTNLTINNINTSSSSDKPLSLDTNEQQLRRKSPHLEQHSKYSDHSSRSPQHNHYSSDRKRRRASSPHSSSTSPSKNNESTNEIISSNRYRKTSRNDERNNSKSYHHHHHHYHHRHRSTSLSPSSRSTSKRSSDSKNDRPSTSSSSDTRHSSKRDDYHSYRHNSSRNYHSTSKSSSSRDHSHSPYYDRRSNNSNLSSPTRIPSTTYSNDSLINRQTSKDDQNRTYNRLKNVHINENNTSSLNPSNHSNKTPSLTITFANTNDGSQRTRSNLVQIVTSEVTSVSHVRSLPGQVKLDSTVSPSASTPTIESTTKTTTNSFKSNSISKTNGNTTGDVIMEEMLLEEEQEQNPVKSIDLDNLTIPENSTKKPDNKNESLPVTPTTPTISKTTITSSPLIPSPVKKPYTLYKVPHTNHTTPPRTSRYKKPITKEVTSITQSDNINKSFNDDNLQPTSLDHRISTMLGEQPIPSIESQSFENQSNPTIQTPTPSDKSTESPQDIKSLIQTTVKKEPTGELRSIALKQSISEERRSTTSKHYTTEWLASQKPEEAIPVVDESSTFPPLVTLPTLVSTQPSTTNPKLSNLSTDTDPSMSGKLSEKIDKPTQKQITNTLPTTTETDDAVPISAKHLERLERRKQREKRQSEIAAIAKEALKPAFKKHTITKEQYKEIMKKVVTKVTDANEVDRTRISKMINAYVEKYRQLRQHSTSKISITSNGKIS